jgi:hypothetical protein
MLEAAEGERPRQIIARGFHPPRRVGYDPAVGTFPGGSAYSMVRDVAEGHLMVTERTLKNLDPPDLNTLSFELERHLREIRGEQPPLDDTTAVQQRNRRIQRINAAHMILRSYRMKNRI